MAPPAPSQLHLYMLGSQLETAWNTIFRGLRDEGGTWTESDIRILSAIISLEIVTFRSSDRRTPCLPPDNIIGLIRLVITKDHDLVPNCQETSGYGKIEGFLRFLASALRLYNMHSPSIDDTTIYRPIQDYLTMNITVMTKSGHRTVEAGDIVFLSQYCLDIIYSDLLRTVMVPSCHVCLNRLEDACNTMFSLIYNEIGKMEQLKVLMEYEKKIALMSYDTLKSNLKGGATEGTCPHFTPDDPSGRKYATLSCIRNPRFVIPGFISCAHGQSG